MSGSVKNKCCRRRLAFGIAIDRKNARECCKINMNAPNTSEHLKDSEMIAHGDPNANGQKDNSPDTEGNAEI